jgi:hypothetical protein
LSKKLSKSCQKVVKKCQKVVKKPQKNESSGEELEELEEEEEEEKEEDWYSLDQVPTTSHLVKRIKKYKCCPKICQKFVPKFVKSLSVVVKNLGRGPVKMKMKKKIGGS